MRKFKLTNSRDDIKRADIKIVYRLNLNDMANVLASYIESQGIDFGDEWFSTAEEDEIFSRELSASQASDVLKRRLRDIGQNALLPETASEELVAWCLKQVQKIVEE